MTDGPASRIDRTAKGGLSRRDFLARTAALGAAMAVGPPLAWAAAGDGDLSPIGIEEHYATPELLRLNGIRIPRARLVDALTDVGAGRIAAMDEAGIAMQVLSTMTPGAQELPGAGGVAFARGLNRWISGEVVSRWPDRFRAFAVLPMQDPEAVADELERAVRDDGLVGCMTYGAIGGRFLDHAAFKPVLARAEALGVPVYIHPASPSPEIRRLYYDGLGDARVGRILAGPGYG